MLKTTPTLSPHTSVHFILHQLHKSDFGSAVISEGDIVDNILQQLFLHVKPAQVECPSSSAIVDVNNSSDRHGREHHDEHRRPQHTPLCYAVANRGKHL